ncbi:Small nuclear ribonucleoprotein-associated protein B [Hypoxylon texense]
MAAFFKAVNAKIRSNPALSYFCSTHFWGPASNFGIPVAAVMDAQKSPELISGQMTFALTIYSATFMRYALAVTPKNYLLFLCHFINEGSQLTQGYRYLQWHHWGGREKAGVHGAVEEAKEKAAAVGDKIKEVASK